MKPEHVEDYKAMIDDCLVREKKLTEWETEFMESLEEQITEKDFITEKQIDVLNRVWERVTARG